MKTLNNILIVTFFGLFALLFSSCYSEIQHYGPNGRNGQAYYAIGFDGLHPYSYWDNNPSVPQNPIIGHYHLTLPGIYDFEYFINPVEYWYGTYEVWILPGGPGQLYDQPGFDAPDTYLTLMCNTDGYYEVRNQLRLAEDSGADELIYEGINEDVNFRITMKKATINERPAQQPKFSSKVESL